MVRVSWAHWLFAQSMLWGAFNLTDFLLGQQNQVESTATAAGPQIHTDLNPCRVSTGSCFGLVGSQSCIKKRFWGLFFVFRMKKQNSAGLGERGGWKELGLKQALPL